MADIFIINFPESMDGKARCSILNEYQRIGWETYPAIDPEQCLYTHFEAFWPDDSKPIFPELSGNCIITKK